MLATKIAASIGTSAGKNGRKPGLGNACPIASKYSEQSQGQHDRGNDQRPFDEDVVAPMFWEWRIGFRHHAISHVVTGLPSASLPSLMATPIATSSSRMRSDSLKSFRARAAVRSSTSV